MSDQTPRVWNTGEPEPPDVTKVRDSMDDVWTKGCDTDDPVWFTADTIPMTWERIAKKYPPLTEVLPAPRTLLGWTVPRHLDMVENDEGVRLTCKNERAYVLASRSIVGYSRALKFLFAHAAGQAVEPALCDDASDGVEPFDESFADKRLGCNSSRGSAERP